MALHVPVRTIFSRWDAVVADLIAPEHGHGFALAVQMQETSNNSPGFALRMLWAWNVQFQHLSLCPLASRKPELPVWGVRIDPRRSTAQFRVLQRWSFRNELTGRHFGSFRVLTHPGQLLSSSTSS